MSHAESVRFHGMTLSIEVVAYVTCMGTRKNVKDFIN